MLGDAFNTVFSAILGVFGLFDTFMVASGAWKYIFGLVVAMLVFRFVIYPFLKVAVVDNSKGSKKSNKGD